jgi:hypothetical protein
VGRVEAVEPLGHGMPPQLRALCGVNGCPVAPHEENGQARIDFDDVFFGQLVLGPALDERAEICPLAIRDPHDAAGQVEQRFRQPLPALPPSGLRPMAFRKA